MDKRWWEFYALRYALGSVMGIFILLYIFIQTDIATKFGLNRLAFLIPKDPKDLSFVHLLFWVFVVWRIVIYPVRPCWYFMH